MNHELTLDQMYQGMREKGFSVESDRDTPFVECPSCGLETFGWERWTRWNGLEHYSVYTRTCGECEYISQHVYADDKYSGRRVDFASLADYLNIDFSPLPKAPPVKANNPMNHELIVTYNEMNAKQKEAFLAIAVAWAFASVRTPANPRVRFDNLAGFSQVVVNVPPASPYGLNMPVVVAHVHNQTKQALARRDLIVLEGDFLYLTYAGLELMVEIHRELESFGQVLSNGEPLWQKRIALMVKRFMPIARTELKKADTLAPPWVEHEPTLYQIDTENKTHS
jgi:hypothetical protein